MIDSVHICYIQLYVVSCCFIDLFNKCVFWCGEFLFVFGSDKNRQIRMSNFDEGVFPRLLPDFLLSKFQHLPFSSGLCIYVHISYIVCSLGYIDEQCISCLMCLMIKTCIDGKVEPTHNKTIGRDNSHWVSLIVNSGYMSKSAVYMYIYIYN